MLILVPPQNLIIACVTLLAGLIVGCIVAIFPEAIQTVFSTNVVAVVFVMAIVLDLILPKDMELKTADTNP